MSQVLSPEDIQHFQKHGYVRLQRAFGTDAMRQALDFVWDLLEEHYGYDRRDPKSWHGPIGGLSKMCQQNTALWGKADARLLSAITQLIGPNWEKPRHWGTLLFSAPTRDKMPWTVSTGTWHWDSDPLQSLGGAKGLFIFSFLSEVKPEGGGTLIVEGSPEVVLRYHRELSPEGRRRKSKSNRLRFYKSHPWLADLVGQGTGAPEGRSQRLMHQVTDIAGIPVRVVELTGQAGDAVLCHPVMLHNRSKNRAPVPRFMRAKFIGGQ